MCGIAGIVSRSDLVQQPVLISMCDAIRHRGPDGSGVWLDRTLRVGLGHRRLAIVEIGELGGQPMLDESEDVALTFNGEIYNFEPLRNKLQSLGWTFRGRSDTEVLLRAYLQWGMMCTEFIDGMFAFAIWDARRRVLFAARDRAGEKPLYFWHTANGIAFASELKALMVIPGFQKSVSPSSLHSLLTLGYVPGADTIFRGVAKLPAAYCLTYRPDTNKLARWRYWSVPPGTTGKARSGYNSNEDYVSEMDRLLTNSVRRQMVADVPVGILLSGGIDSSLVAAVAAHTSASPVSTFTITFPGHGHFNEARYAKEIASHLGTQHNELVAEPASFELLPMLATQFDEPMIDSSMIPMYLVSKLIRSRAGVALGGDGGDELFGGYSLYGRLLQADVIRKMVVISPRAHNFLLNLVDRSYQGGVRGKNYLPALRAMVNGLLPNPRNLFLNSDLYHIYSSTQKAKDFDWGLPSRIGEEYNQPSESLLYRLCRADYANYLCEDILVKVDRASMLNSLEVRAPFLDRRIVEFAFGFVPDSLKCHGGQRKVLLREVAKRYFPASYDYNRKQGFSLPLSAWFRSGTANDLLDVIAEINVPVFDQKQLRGYFREMVSGRHSEQLFGIALFSLWCKEYKVSL